MNNYPIFAEFLNLFYLIGELKPVNMEDTLASPMNMVSANRISKGGAESPFLAPRHVFLSRQKLFVADTAQNRIFIGQDLPVETSQTPNVVLGQTDAIGTMQLGHASPQTLFYSSGLWCDCKKRMVADALNHRVLIWNQVHHESPQPADVVIGQPGFTQNERNANGISSTPPAKSLKWPYRVFSDASHMWTADTTIRSVIYYDAVIPVSNYVAPDRLIGKESFSNGDYDHMNPVRSYSVEVNKYGVLAVTDTQYYRVLIWQNEQKAFT